MQLGGCSATGPRKVNEDSLLTMDLSGSGSFSNGVVAYAMVSDGMGGYQGGDVASALAVSCARAYLDKLVEMARGNLVELDAAAALAEIVENAHEAILAETRARGNASMGATFIGTFVSPQHAWIGHVGDSRAYVVGNGHVRQLTEDHSQVGRMLARGLITETEAQRHPSRNRIERALGFADAAIDITEVDLGPGDSLVLCSDGVYTVLNVKGIGSRVVSAENAEEAARRLVESALAKGTDDNATAAVVMLDRGKHAGNRVHSCQPTERVTPVAVSGGVRASDDLSPHSQTQSTVGSRYRRARWKGSVWIVVVLVVVVVILAVAAFLWFTGFEFS